MLKVPKVTLICKTSDPQFLRLEKNSFEKVKIKPGQIFEIEYFLAKNLLKLYPSFFAEVKGKEKKGKEKKEKEEKEKEEKEFLV